MKPRLEWLAVVAAMDRLRAATQELEELEELQAKRGTHDR